VRKSWFYLETLEVLQDARLNILAKMLDSQGKYKEAEQMQRQQLKLCEKVLSKEHPETLSMNNHTQHLGLADGLANR